MSTVKRLVVLLPGFEHMPVVAHYRRFIREAAKTAPVYDMNLKETAPLSVATDEDGVAVGDFQFRASGENWAVETDFLLYGLGDITLFYASRNPAVRLFSGLFALIDFIVTGTFFRFVATSWRYALFFLYPILTIACILAISLSLAYAGAVVTGSLLGWILAPLLAILLFRHAARHMHLLLLMDDWTFARDMARGKRPQVMAKMDKVISDAAARISSASPETEIIVAAHSLGAICALPILATALARDPRRRYGLLTVGSSLLKVALHPAASKLRAAVAAVACSKSAWIDAQSLTDPMNFYKSDPIRNLALSSGKSPVRVMVRFRNQLREDSYRTIRRNFFRVHRQFVFGVDKRTRYSWHAILCGPQPFAEIAACGGLPCDSQVRAEPEMEIARTAAT